MNQEVAAASAPTQVLAPDLTPDYDLRMTVVNERVIIRDDPVADWRVVFVNGVVFACYRRGDAASERHACVRLRLSGLAMQVEIADAFGHVRATQCRWERAFRVNTGFVLDRITGFGLTHLPGCRGLLSGRSREMG
jgi:hypothetical protein